MNYNSLMNKPTINYRELIGDNTVTEVGGITEEEFNALLTTDLSSYYTKAEINELFARSFIEKEKSGSIVTFDCPSSKNGISEVTSEIVAVQSGTGDPSPTNVRPISGWSAVDVTDCGKNLFDKTATDTNKGFISGKWINQTGNTFSYGDWNVSEYIRVDGEKIAVSGMTVAEQVSSGRGGYCCYDKYKNVLGGSTYNALTQIITLPTNTEYIRISVWNQNKDVCQLELSSTATTYEPYNGSTYTTQLKDGQGNPLTCYGGQLVNENGVQSLTLTHGYIASYNGETLPSTWISDRDVYAEGTTPTTGAEVVYTLAPPQQITQDSLSIASSAGINNIWCDSGDITVKALDRIIQG